MINKKRTGLGRGLGALMGDTSEKTANDEVEAVESHEIPLNLIDTNPYQPRHQFDSQALNELKESIQVQGVIQPIAVRKQDGRYQLISGERRLKASEMAGLKTIPAYIREATDNQMLELGIIENVQRENLNAIEIANAYQRLIDECNLNHTELGERVGKDRTTVNNYLRLLSLPHHVQEGLAEGKLSMGHARALLGLTNPNQIEKAYNEVISKHLSVRKVEELVKNMNTAQAAPKPSKSAKAPTRKYHLEDFQQQLGAYFSKKVIVEVDENKKGEIIIAYNSKKDLEEIIEKLKN